MIPIHKGKVINKRFTPYQVEKYFVWLESLEGEEVDCVIKKKQKPRSVPENKYYWAVIIGAVSDITGYTEDEAHEAMKLLFLRKKEAYRGDRKLPETVRSTTELTTVEFENYLSSIRQWASAEFGYYIPLPNEVDY
jgi:hypothetical protein